MTNRSPIGIFDSGLGGLTVMKELVKVLPHENFLYYADSAHLPYGEKSKSYLIDRAHAIVSFFEEKKVKLIVAACHTASATALEEAQNKTTIPTLGIVESAIQALAAEGALHIAVLATKATIDSKVYQLCIKKQIKKATVLPIACPHFVPLIENDKEVEDAIYQTLKQLESHSIDTLLLGSTHYPLIQSSIRKQLNPAVKLIDPSATFAVAVYQFLLLHHLLNPKKTAGEHHFFSSKKSYDFHKQASRILLANL